jgi:G3E family GTPase
MAAPQCKQKMRRKKMTKLLIMGGFLGAGKTSVILDMARHMVSAQEEDRPKVVILENEIGQISIDDKTLESVGFNVETLFSGCVCCTMSGELVANLHVLIDRFSPDWIILETTGMAYPGKVKASLAEMMPDLPCYICCLADAKRWPRMQKVPQLAEFSRQQLEEANLILVNKSDLVGAPELEEVDASVRAINQEASIYHISAKNGIPKEVWNAVFREDLI